MNKKGNMQGAMIVVFLILASVFILDYIGVLNIGKQSIAGGERPTTEGVNVATCFDTPLITVGPMEKKYTNTKLTSEFAGVWQRKWLPEANEYGEWQDLGNLADGATFDADEDDQILVVYGLNSTTYYAAAHVFTVPCRESIHTADFANGKNKLYELDASTNLNIKFFNADDGNLNWGTAGKTSGSTNESMGAGDTVVLKGTYQGQYQDAYSPYGKILATVMYYSTMYDDIIYGESGKASTTATTPMFRSTKIGKPGYTWKTVGVPGILSSEERIPTLTVIADGTTAPAQPYSSINITWDDEDYWQNTYGEVNPALSVDGVLVSGVNLYFGAETNANADVGHLNGKNTTITIN